MKIDFSLQKFEKKMKSKSLNICIIGLGYVGLPLAAAFCENGFQVLGLDTDHQKIAQLNSGKSYIKHIPDQRIYEIISKNLFQVTEDFSLISSVDVIIICVPTPLSKHREPDLGPVLNTGASIAPHLKDGQLVVLESSTYPGTTDKELKNVLEKLVSTQTQIKLLLKSQRCR